MVTRIKVGAKVVAGNFPIHRQLNGNHPLGGDASSVEPHGDSRLADSSPGHVRQLFGQRGLPTRKPDSPLQRTDTHMDGDYNTASVINVNTRSAIGFGQTYSMARNGETSDFWVRLAQARRAKNASASMRQEDVAKDYGVRQSAVTKWKTGKSMPQPELVREMAIKHEVAFEWLNSGRGDMRPPKATDPITVQVIQAMESLRPEAKVEVLKAALTQQALQLPALAAQIEQAHKSAEKLIKPPPRKVI